MAASTYRVRVGAGGGLWVADVVGVPGAHATAETRGELRLRIDQAIRRVEVLPDDAELDVVEEVDLELYRIAGGIEVSDIDLDEEEFYLPDGRRLTEELAEELGERYASPHTDPEAGDRGLDR